MSQTTLLKVSEVAQVLKLNILTVYQYIRQEKLSAVKIGRNYRIEEKDLRGFSSPSNFINPVDAFYYLAKGGYFWRVVFCSLVYLLFPLEFSKRQ